MVRFTVYLTKLINFGTNYNVMRTVIGPALP